MSGDYWPDGGRFGVMCIRGFSNAAGSSDYLSRQNSYHGFSFWVVDLDEMGREIKCFKARGKSLTDRGVLAARGRARREVDRLNKLDAKVAA